MRDKVVKFELWWTKTGTQIMQLFRKTCFQIVRFKFAVARYWSLESWQLSLVHLSFDVQHPVWTAGSLQSLQFPCRCSMKCSRVNWRNLRKPVGGTSEDPPRVLHCLLLTPKIPPKKELRIPWKLSGNFENPSPFKPLLPSDCINVRRDKQKEQSSSPDQSTLDRIKKELYIMALNKLDSLQVRKESEHIQSKTHAKQNQGTALWTPSSHAGKER